MVSPQHPSQGETHTYKTLLQFPEETSMFGEPTVPVKGGAYVSWNAMAPGKQLAPPAMQFRDNIRPRSWVVDLAFLDILLRLFQRRW